ncbi:hypothetical protein [Streptomyces sp. GMR22]|uniref:hypothetical protein n=1 Tax=Streptomyces sp. GMR22 TaxID=2759524 RepID=UPI0015F94A81|nr:hypothetical protein [Streptomyces sp. GMR22]MBA6439073.1 hypothetical protein [Streptomyces sp. GMR22]
MLNAARLRLRYQWVSGTDRRVVAAHSWLAARVRPWVAVTSTARPDTPTIAYAGVPDGVVKIHQLLEQRREALGRGTTDRTAERVDRAAVLRGLLPRPADLVAVGCSAAQAAALPTRSALVLPFRLHLLAYLGGGLDQWLGTVSESERRWVRSARRRARWGLEIAADSASFEHFYHRMYLPTMRGRHGDRARCEPVDLAREALFGHGVLAFLTREGERVAGSLGRWDARRGRLTLRLFGVLDGSDEHYRDGSSRVLDFLLLEWAHGFGARTVDFGGIEPFLSQGIFQRKRKLASRAVLGPTHLGAHRLWWHARHDTPAVRDFLVANPVVEIVGRDRLRAVYFHDETRPPRLDLARTHEGIDEVRSLALDEFFAR